MDIKNLLDKEIERLLSHIETLGYGTDEREAAISELTRLYKLRIDETKNEQEYKKDCERRAMEREFHQADEALKRDQMAQELKLHEAEKALKKEQMKADADARKAEEKLKREQMSQERELHESDASLRERQIESDRVIHQADETLKRDQMTAERELRAADEALKRDQMATEVKLHQADESLKRDQMAMEREFHEADDKSKREQLSDQGIERYFRYGAMALELVLPIVAYGMWYRKGLKFEETGTVTSPMTKNLIAKMLPKKK